MNRYKLGGIEFIYKQYKNIEEDSVEETIYRIYSYIEKNSFAIVNGYIFTEYKNNYFIKSFSKKNNVNLIYSRESNKLNIQLLLTKDNGIFSLVKDRGEKVGVNFISDNVNILHLDNINFDKIDFAEQTKQTYDLVFKHSKKLGFDNTHFVKAWNFIEDILEKYSEFNLIRDHYFLNEKIIGNYPAGTGIDCLLPSNIKHLSNYFFVKDKSAKIKIETLSNNIQCEAYDYGPKFSRGKIVKSEFDNNDIILISGTAAVNEKGESIFVDDIENNINYTFKSIEVLLKKGGTSFDDIISAFIYIKDKRFEDTFLRIYKENNYSFPYIHTFCDVCRDDFLFEMECVGVKKYK